MAAPSLRFFTTAPRQLAGNRVVGAAPKRHNVRSARPVMAVASDLPVANDVVASYMPPNRATVNAVRKYLLSIGWELAWIDGVTAEITKNNLKTSPEQCEAVINYLQSIGIPLRGVENMASISKAILGRSVDELKAVVSYLEKEGLSGKPLADFLIINPTILNYTPSSDGKCVEKGAARAAVTFGKRGDRKVAGIVQWRDGASFGTSPVAPQEPQKL